MRLGSALRARRWKVISLCAALVGPDRFYAGIPKSELMLLRLMLDILRSGVARTPSLQEVELSDAVFILGEDVTECGAEDGAEPSAVRPSAAYRSSRNGLKIPLWQDHGVREAIQNDRGPALHCDSRQLPGLTTLPRHLTGGAPDDLARLGYAVAHALDPAAPSVEGLASRSTDVCPACGGRSQSRKAPVDCRGREPAQC